jgi:hypothetical protein
MNITDLTPVFICGHYRSGTSLLHHLLDGHSKIVSAGIETNFFTVFKPKISTLGVNEALRISLLRVIESNDQALLNKHLPGIDIEKFRLVFNEFDKNENNVYSFLEAYVQAHAKATNQTSSEKLFWIEKTPLNELFIQDILKKWPHAKFIHMIRDPRDVHASIRKRSDFPLKVRTTYHNWLRSIQAKTINQMRYPDQCITLRYEDLVLDTDACILKICDFLKIENEDVLKTPTLSGGMFPWKGNSLGGEKKSIDSDALSRWKTFEPQSEVRLMEALAENAMKALGYKIDREPTIKYQIQALRERLVLVFKKVRQLFIGDPAGTY